MKEDIVAKYPEETELFADKFNSHDEELIEDTDKMAADKVLQLERDIVDKDDGRNAETAMLLNLLSKIKKPDENYSESDYSDEETDDQGSKDSSSLNTDYTSLLQEMSSIDINKNSQDYSKTDSASDDSKKIDKTSVISDVHSLFKTNKAKITTKSSDDGKDLEKSGKNRAEKKQPSKNDLKKSDTKNSKGFPTKDDGFNKKDDLLERLNALKISNKNNKKLVQTCAKDTDNGIVGKKDGKNDNVKTKKPKHKVLTIFLERGPWSEKKKFGVTNQPYEINQVNRKCLSGGKFWTEKETNNLIPRTINSLDTVLLDSISYVKNITNQEGSDNNGGKQPSEEYAALAFELEQECNQFFQDQVRGRRMAKKNARNKAYPNGFYDWEQDLNMIMEILESDAKNVSPNCDKNRDEVIIPKIVLNSSFDDADTSNYSENQPGMYSNTSSITSPRSDSATEYIEESFHFTKISPDALCPDASSTFSSSPGALGAIQINVNHTDNNARQMVELGSPNLYSSRENTPDLRASSSSLNSSHSPFNYNFSESSPEQCYKSPNVERIESNNCYNLYELSPPVKENLRESFSSSSTLESPRIDVEDDFNVFNNALIELSPNINDTQKAAPKEVFNDLYSISQSDQYLDQGVANQFDPMFTNTLHDLNFVSAARSHQQTVEEIEKQIEKEANKIVSSGFPVVQFAESKVEKGTRKSKVLPIAARQSYPCCETHKKNAKDILEQMFERLDKRMQRNICLKVHNLDEENLMKLLDCLLSRWEDTAGMQLPRLPLMYTVCERLLMKASTMYKFFKTYGNGHTVLDRAILTCPKTPLLANYLAECCVKAMKLLPPDKDFVINKIDILGNGILHRALSSGVVCASSLATLLVLNKDNNLFDINQNNADGYNPLHLACNRHTPQSGGLGCACLVMSHVLLEHGGADPNMKDGTSGNTSLHTAVDSGECAPNLILLLLKYGADTSIRNYRSLTPLDLGKSASRSCATASAKQVVDIMKKFNRQL